MPVTLEEFEAARSDRALRTDYPGYVTTIQKGKNGDVEVVDMVKSSYRTRTSHLGTAATLAQAYVVEHPELEARYGEFTTEELVGLVDTFRASGNTTRVMEIEAWLMGALAPSGESKHPPQHIHGFAWLMPVGAA